jgi:hypothetical protein
MAVNKGAWPKPPGREQSLVALAENPLVHEPEVPWAIMEKSFAPRADAQRGHPPFLSLFQQRMHEKRDFHLSPFRRYRFGHMHSSIEQVACP